MFNMKKTVSLVLSSGGARGIAHIGAIEELEKHGFKINVVAGSSIGAAIGGIYASGNLKKYKNWVLNLDKYGVFKLMDFTFSSHGFIKGEKVKKEMRKFLGDPDIEDLNIPYIAVATDLYNQKEVVFTKGNLFEAIRASASIPSILEPYVYDNTILIDGGVINPLPINKVINFKNDLIVAINLNAEIPYVESKSKKEKKKKNRIAHYKQLDVLRKTWQKFFPEENYKPKKPGYFTLLNNTFDLMQNRLTEISIEKYNPEVLVNISRHACGMFEFYRSEELLLVGEKAMYECLKAKGLI